MRYTLVSLLAVTGFSQLSLSAILFVAPTGSDTAAGTITAPLKSIQIAVNKATAGSTINIRAGTYALTKNVNFAKSGTASAPYTVQAYNGEKVVIDGEGLVGYVLQSNYDLEFVG